MRVLWCLVLGAAAIGYFAGCAGVTTPAYNNSKSKEPERKQEDVDLGGDCSDFSLTQSAPTYDDDIKDFLDDNCNSCHGGSDSRREELDTYEAVKRLAVESLEWMEDADRPMPPSGQLDSDKIQLFADWVDAGTPETSDDVEDSGSSSDSDSDSDSNNDSDRDGDDDDDDSSGSSNSDCDEPEDDPPPRRDPPEEEEEKDPKVDITEVLLDTAKQKECHDAGQLYDRSSTAENPTGSCHEASYPVEFECDRDGVAGALAEAGLSDNNQTQFLDAADSFGNQGYTYDQCGMLNDIPVLAMYCFVDDAGKCIEKDKVDQESAQISVQIISF